jgi:MATE family multidrug resistance protein
MGSVRNLDDDIHDRRGLLRREVKASVRLAVPVVTVQVGMMLMGTVDTTMLGHFSAQALAAGAIGNIFSMALLWFGAGILAALDPLIGQAFGAGDHDSVGGHLRRGLLLAAALAIPVSLAMVDLEPLLRRLGEPAGVIHAAALYTRLLIIGNLPFLLFFVVRQALQAMSIVRPAMLAIAGGNVVNGLVNYALIFGRWGCPSLGVAGSACATAAARWVMFLWLIAASWRHLTAYLPRRRDAGAGASRGDGGPHGGVDHPPARQADGIGLQQYTLLLRIGVPIGLHQALELSLFVAVALLMGRFGTAAIAGHQIAILLVSLSFMVPLGISGAATTRVGNAIGRGDMPGARRTAAVCLGLGAGVMTLFAAAFALFPRQLAVLFTDDAAVIAAAVALLPIAAIFQILDGVQVVSAGVLRGTADTTLPAAAALVGYLLLGLPLGCVLAFPGGLGPRGLWWGVTLGLAVVASALAARIVVRFRGHIGRISHL